MDWIIGIGIWICAVLLVVAFMRGATSKKQPKQDDGTV